ncbi:MAG: PQ-loop domain-containing transporter [Pseudolabrys sp.]
MTLPLIIDFVGVAGALLTTLCWLPQMLRTVREKYTRALSLPATSAFTVGILLWLMAPILAMKLRYG